MSAKHPTNAAEHIEAANRYRGQAAEAQNYAYDAHLAGDDKTAEHGRFQSKYYNDAAQVHATLALAHTLATALEPLARANLAGRN